MDPAARFGRRRHLAGLVGGEEPLSWRLLVWNLFHGRDFPPEPRPERAGISWRLLGRPVRGREYALVNRDLLPEFAATLAAGDWDAALLQEVPPRWAARLAGATGAKCCRTLTSRNWMRPVTAVPARARPHLVGSWEGGCNVILVRERGPGTAVAGHRRATLRLWPERRVVSMAVTRSGLCLANLHASTGDRSGEDVLKAAGLAARWAGDAPLVLGGDFNLRPARSGVFAELERSHGLSGVTDSAAIDHVLCRGAAFAEPAEALPAVRREVSDPATGLKLRLSDHRPLVCRLSL